MPTRVGLAAIAPPSGGLSVGVARQLVTMLFDQTLTLVVAGLAFTSVIALCWVRTGQTWFLVWAATALAVLAGRLILQFAFGGARNGAGELRAWRIAFVAGAWAMGAVWGATALTVLKHEESLVLMLVISVQNVIIMGGAARNASCPLAARGQTVLGLAPLFAACVAANDVYMRFFSVFLGFAFFAAQTLIHHLYDQHVRFLRMNEENVALLDQLRQANRELAGANEQLAHAATIDSLTGIANRRRFDAALVDEVRRSGRDGSELSLLFLDIDAFKGFNDLYGHQAGDACLQQVAAAFANAVRRPVDVVARYGGEEFAAILPRTGAESARAIAEVVRHDVEALALRNAAGPTGFLSVSIGVTSFAAGRFRRPEDFIKSADEALYAAKAAGRNCVRLARDDGGNPAECLPPDGGSLHPADLHN